MPDVSRLVRQVTRTGKPRLLQVDGEAALLSPARAPRAKKGTVTSREGLQQLLDETRGSWRDLIDAEAFKRQRRELQFDDRNPRSL